MPDMVPPGNYEEDPGFMLLELDELDHSLEKAWEDSEALKQINEGLASTPLHRPTQSI